MSTSLAPARVSVPFHAPTLACVRQRVRAAIALEDVADLTRLVQIDGALAGAVLRILGCPFYQPDEGETGTAAERAVQRLSPAILSRVADGLPVRRAVGTREETELVCMRWIHALAVASACRWLANTGAFHDPEAAFVTGLMHDLGARIENVPPERSSEATGELLGRFGLPETVRHAVRFHGAVQRGMPAESIAVGGRKLPDETRRLLTLLAHADLLVSGLGFGATEDPGDLAEAIAAATEGSDAAAVLESVELELRHVAALLGLDDVEPHDLLRRLTNEELRTDEVDRAEPPGVERTAARLAEVHRRLMAARECHSVHGILERGLHEISDGLGFGRLVLLDPDPASTERLRARTVLDPAGLTLAGGLLGFEVPRLPGGAIEAVISDGTAALIEDPSRDGATLESFAVDQLLAAPLSAGAAHFGIVAVDQFFTGRRLTDEDAALLGLLCDALGLVLQNAALDVQGETLRSLAEKDELTGINNRRNIVNILDREMRRAERFGHPMSIALLDVDHFKKWNDTHGHQVGDVVLKAVAQLIASCSRDVDGFGRYGGEEFLVVLPETPLSHAVLYAERLRVSIETEGAEMFPQYAPTHLSVSIGVTSYTPGDNVDRIVHRADEALYAAKKYGRNRVCVEAGPAAPPTDS